MGHLCSHTFQKHPLVLQYFFNMSAPREEASKRQRRPESQSEYTLQHTASVRPVEAMGHLGKAKGPVGG